jgi:hypothetical protein
MHADKLDRFFGIPSHRVRSVYFVDASRHEVADDGQVDTVVVELERVERDFSCSCGRRFGTYYDFREQFVRDLPWGPWGRWNCRCRVSGCAVRTAG